MKKKIKSGLSYLISHIGYPKIIRVLINNSPSETNIDIAEGGKIETNVRITGQVKIDSNSIIKSGSKLSSETFIKKNVRIGRNVALSGNTLICEGTNIGEGSSFVGPVEIGRYNAVGPEVLFQAKNHTTSRPSQQVLFYKRFFEESLPHRTEGGIKVGSDIWIGRRAILLPGVKVGHGSIIGAGSVVTKDVKPYSVVAGVPAKKIKWRFDEDTRTKLLEMKWWEWDKEKIINNKEFFMKNISDGLNIDT